MNKGFDSLLRRSLREQRSESAETCLDANTTAAWFAGTLPAAELAQARAHASRCSRCQEVIAALASIEEPRRAPAWWRAHAVRWMMPAIGAAAAAIVWFNVPSEPRAPVPPSPAQSRAEATAQPGAAAPSSATSAAAENRGGMSPAAAPSSPVRNDATRRADQAAAGFADVAPPPGTAPPVPERLNEAALARERTASTAAALAAPPASAPTSAPALAQAPPQPPVASGVAEDAARQEVTSQVQPRTLESMAMLAAGSPRVSAGAVIASPGQRTFWRITGTQVFRSVDAGVTWQQRQTGASAPLTAGASPSDDVCWIVGRGGVVLQTKDGGQTWKTIAFPASEDLVAVTAADDKAATVIAAGGRTFRTTDGGITWR